MPYTWLVYMTYNGMYIDYINRVIDIHERFSNKSVDFALSGNGIFKIRAILQEQKAGF